MSRLSPQINPLTFHSRSQTSLFLFVFSVPSHTCKQGTPVPFCASACWWRCPPNPCFSQSFVLRLRFFLRKDAVFRKPNLSKIPLPRLLFLCSIIPMFHWLVQNPFHVRPNGQQFAHFVLRRSILSIILFPLCHKSFIFRLQHLNSRELCQLPFIKSLFSSSMNQNFLFMPARSKSPK